MRYVKVEGKTDLVRDLNTNCIVNTNMNEYQNYLYKKKMKDMEDKKIEAIEKELSEIKGNIDEIKSLLRSLINESR